MKITFIRHSKTNLSKDIAITEWPLSNDGQRLAEKLASDPLIKSLDVIYSSLQVKALQTAIALNKDKTKRMEVAPGLTEVTSLTNGLLSNYEQEIELFLERKVERFNDGESIPEALERFEDTLKNIVEFEKDKGSANIGVISHGTILSLFTSKYSHLSVREIHKKIEMPDIAIFDWHKKIFNKLFNKLES